ncbi:hypothetical protein MIMGU_mgv1a009302mg [Erythranthe guttata]|uniref:F-box domain-containing protein n=1 Tax=Erythranthe guttata TaxID=4155 RepID=A0A022Q6H5_ERYGU|nr:hypothetical protein MIMGU_mgv1a009302mg [Erythranthe guttata]
MEFNGNGSYSWSAAPAAKRQLSDPKLGFRNHPTLSDDLLFRIFISLPGEVIVKLQFVCKRWFDLINTSIFVACHAQKSDTVLICQKLTLCHPVIPPDSPRRFHFLDFGRRESNSIESSMFELVDIRASFDGLVLAFTEKKTSLILVNPITRKHVQLPLAVDDKFCDGSYGISFDDKAKTYKIVHLFIEESGYNGAEIISVRTKKWTRLDGPDLLIDTNEIAFVSKKLPACRADKDRLLDLGGNLGFVTHVENELQVWISVVNSENWIKKCSIDLGVKARYFIPICSSRNGEEMVLENREHRFYVRNFENRVMKRIYSIGGRYSLVKRMDKLYIPHRNTLVSFDRSS